MSRLKLTIAAVIITAIGTLTYLNADTVFTPIAENDFIKNLKTKAESFFEKLPQDRLYLQFDKTFYEPGETIWFSAYVRNAQTMQPSEMSDILHVQLIGPRGNVERELNIIAKNGKAAGDFLIDAEAAGGLYKINAYTQWQKNEPDTLQFEKEIQVQDVVLPALKMKLDFERKAYGPGDDVIAKVELNTNENRVLANYKFNYVASIDGEQLISKNTETGNDGTMYVKFSLPKKLKTSDGLLNVMIDYEGKMESISRAIPITLNKIKLTFYPEGGDLVNGLESRVAFRALNEFNKPADVEGEITDSKGNHVSNFVSFHNGMGAFILKTNSGEKYFAKITKPANIDDVFELPEMLPLGYIMNVDNQNKSELNVDIRTSQSEQLSLVASIRDKVYYTNAVDVKEGLNSVSLSTANMPMGVCRLTLFDSKNIARCERLVFVNRDKQLNIEIKTDKEKYLPREKVVMTVYTKDERGMPMPANLSLTVTNDQMLSFADDKQGNILSELFLQQDLKEKVEEPAFYFSKEAKANQALDYLLMTSGWRRFTWEKILSNQQPAISYNGEKAIVGGTVYDGNTGQVIKNATIRINDKLNLQTNGEGKFSHRGLDLSQPASVKILADNYPEQTQNIYAYNQNQIFYVYKHNREVLLDAVEVREEMLAPQAAGAVQMNELEVVQIQAKNVRVRNVPAKKAKAEAAPKLANVEKAVEVKDVAVMADEPNANGFAEREDLNEGKKNKQLKEVVVFDKRMRADTTLFKQKQQPAQQTYYRARQFAAPVYANQKADYVRNDFRSTIFWNPEVEIDKSGKKVIEFYTSDEITSFRAMIEGISSDGLVGREEKTIYTQLPFAMTTKVPAEILSQDFISIPLTLKNNTQKVLSGNLNVDAPKQFTASGSIPSTVSIEPGSVKVVYLSYNVTAGYSTDTFNISFKANGLSDAFVQPIKISSKGFPVTASFSGKETNSMYHVDIKNMVPGSMYASVTAYPSVVSDLMKGVESILREPGGCFEQTSMSSYPNIMVMDYLKATETDDPKLMARADKLIDNGYKKLTAFETKSKGYEWFGSSPGHEALTAYGLMQFNDMKEVYAGVDQKMIDRTADWLLARRDGDGGYKRDAKALDSFGRASKDVTDCYITYALTSAGYKDLKNEVDHMYKVAMDKKDPYMLGLAANGLFKFNRDHRAENALEELMKQQKEDGSFAGKEMSITCSGGQALSIETTSLAVMAMLQSDKVNNNALNKSVDYLVKSRNGYGSFGNTQSTILALKAMTGYAKYSKKTNEDGTIELYVDGNKVAEKDYAAGERNAIQLSGFEKYLGEGKHRIELKYRRAKNPLPYSIAVTYNTFLPVSQKECEVDLNTKLASKQIAVGQTIRMTATLKNKTEKGLPSTIAIIGVPAGLSVQPWQLKDMMEKGKFDFYEMRGNNIVCYYRQMKPNEVRELNFDLKAEVPGDYEAQASTAYLYYTNEFKCWTGLDKIKIVR